MVTFHVPSDGRRWWWFNFWPSKEHYGGLLAKTLHDIMGLSGTCSCKKRLLGGEGGGYNSCGGRKWPCMQAMVVGGGGFGLWPIEAKGNWVSTKVFLA